MTEKKTSQRKDWWDKIGDDSFSFCNINVVSMCALLFFR